MIDLLAVLPIGALRGGVADVLVILALLLMTVAASGLVLAKEPVTRLHFLAPASTLALPCFGIAAILAQGPSLGSAAIAVAVAAAALSAPALTTSIARLISSAEAGDRSGERSG